MQIYSDPAYQAELLARRLFELADAIADSKLSQGKLVDWALRLAQYANEHAKAIS